MNLSTRKFFVVGLTHIDLAWKMDSEEHRELMEAAMLRLVDVLDQDPDYTYTIEQADHFRLLNERRPDLIARLRKHIEDGRIEFAGGLASTLETNGPSGESFVRNQLLGMESVRQLFGVTIDTGYLIDTFGINAQVPQILSQFGITHLLANRFGGNLSRDVFVARGLDGSRILIAGRDANSPYVAPERVFFHTARDHRQIEALFAQASETPVEGPCLVMPYTEYVGIARTHVSTLVDQRNAAEGAERWAFATLREFFGALPGLDGGWPEIASDLNPEFTGTFGLRPKVRTLHRAAESLLIESDKWAALLELTDNADGSGEAWWKMAFAQSHDVYTGSHPTSVNVETIERLEEVEAHARTMLGRCAASLATPASPAETTLIAFNGLPWQRDAVVECRLPAESEEAAIIAVRDDSGRDLPFEQRGDLLRFRAPFSGLAARRLTLERAPTGNPVASAASEAPPPGGARIANDFVSVEGDRSAGLRIFPKASADDPSRAIGVQITLQEDRGNFQIEDFRGAEIASNAVVSEVCAPIVSPVLRQLTLKGRFPGVWTENPDPLSWELECTIYPDRPQIDLALQLDWHGEASRVRLRVDTPLGSSTGIFEVPFGTVTREPYRVRRTARGEWPAHRWVAVEENGEGVALVNTGMHGAEVAGGVIWTTLLRAPVTEYAGMIPDETSSQHGRHAFGFSLLPYKGSWRNSGVLRLAQEVNVPVWCSPLPSGPLATENPWLALSPDTVVLSGVKLPEDRAPGEVILRVYEATGEAVTAQIFVRGATAAWHSDLRETKLDPATCTNGTISVDMKPFEIKTLRIVRSEIAREATG